MWKKAATKEYYPAVEAAANYWCETLAGAVTPEKLAIFKQALSKEIAVLFDSREGVIEIHAEVPHSENRNVFEKPGKPSGVLLKAMKKARLPVDLLPPKTTMIISASAVKVYTRTEYNPKTLWEKRYRGK